MVDAPEPLPGFSEPQFDMFDSGAEYASLDVAGGEVDAPVSPSYRRWTPMTYRVGAPMVAL